MKKLLLFIGISLFRVLYRICTYVKRQYDKLRNLWFYYVYRKHFHYLGVGTYLHPSSYVVGVRFISIGDNTAFSEGCYITAWDTSLNNKNVLIKVGENCSFGAWNHITAINYIEIGNYVLTGKWVTITDNSHGDTDKLSLTIPPIKRSVVSKGAVVIKDNVWIGDKVTILPNVTIGKGAVIAANAVVTHDVPPYSVVGGNPAKILK